MVVVRLCNIDVRSELDRLIDLAFAHNDNIIVMGVWFSGAWPKQPLLILPW